MAPVEGEGGIVNTVSHYVLVLSNAYNTVNGPITPGYETRVCSIGDGVGAGPINLGVTTTAGKFTWIGAAGSTTTLTNRQFALSGTTGGGTLVASGSTAADNLVIRRDLAVSGTGNKTLTLDGGNQGTNVFDGAITDATNSVISLVKSSTGTWALGGTNSYSGATTISAGKLFINGDQSAATNSVFVAASATLGGSGTIGGNVTVTNSGRLEFSISTAPAGHDSLELVAGKKLTFTGASVLTITSSGGAATGTYVLVTGGDNIAGLVPASVLLPTGLTATVQISGNSLLLLVSPHTLTYNGNGNNGGAAPVDGSSPYQPNATVTVLDNTDGMVRTGYSFSGWNTATNGTGTQYTPGNTFVIVTNMTLYARWTVNNYTVTFDKQGGSGGSNSVVATYGAAMPVATGVPTRTGYTFGGYYTATNGGGTQYYTNGDGQRPELGYRC
jgi:uncharacterized repeat protein (TIGR02543 family)